MKIKTSSTFFFEYLVLTLLFVTSISLGLAQSPTKDESDKKQDENTIEDNHASLDGLTEAILVDGQPTLRILSRKGSSTEVKFKNRGNEGTFVFDVIKFPNSTGKLYVTKTKVTYDPDGGKKRYFSVEKTKIKDVDLHKLLGGIEATRIDDGEDKKPFIVMWNTPSDKRSINAANNFLLRTIKDFDSALLEFNNLTASVRPKPEEDEEAEKEEESNIEVGDKYDRFKDITIINTSRMLVRGTKRSIRAEANYNFAGKNQKKPEKVSLYFYASAARPLFREDDLDLNFLVDGKRIPLGELRLADEEKTKTTTKQTIVVTMPYETFAQIANSKKAEFQIGKLEYKLTGIHLEAFRKLLTYKIEE